MKAPAAAAALLATCPKCGRDFAPTRQQLHLIDSIRANGGPLAMLECPHCYADFGFQLQERGTDDDPYRCPVIRCDGWVSHVTLKGRPPFDGCGECGSTWKRKESLFRDISDAVKRFPYRAKSYRKHGDGWRPGDPDKEAKNYEDKVAQEPKELGLSHQKD